MRCLHSRSAFFARLKSSREDPGGQQRALGGPCRHAGVDHLRDAFDERREVPERARLLCPKRIRRKILAPFLTPCDDPFAVRVAHVMDQHRAETVAILDKERRRFEHVAQLAFEARLLLARIRDRSEDAHVETSGLACLPDGISFHGAVEKPATWDASKTALIICDMWDDHWCKSAARRVVELAGPLNETVKTARAKGVFIIHSPSSVTDFYKDTPQRQHAKKAPFAPTPVPLATAERWGTAWCWPDGAREQVLPIDDSDMGCSCTGTKCEIKAPWTRQIATIEIGPDDALTDHGQETWNLLAARGIDNVLCGVHLNMCVLGRPFAIRQMVTLGKKVALLRDLTDTMYNPERPPGVDHFTGTDLVIAHVERNWCPTFTSADLTGRVPFRFKEDRRPPASHTAPTP